MYIASASTSDREAGAVIDGRAVELCRRQALPMALVGGAVMSLLVWRIDVTWALPAFLYIAVVGTLLATVDLYLLRLPDRLVLPSYPVAASLLGIAAIAGSGGSSEFIRALLGMALSFAVYLILALINPSGLGFGDVKLAGLLGLYLGWAGWHPLFWGIAGGFFLMALAGIAMLVTGMSNRRAVVPFGPFMLAGALLAVIV